MSHRVTGSAPTKRGRSSTDVPSKKRKLTVENGSKVKGKQRAFERATIPIPQIPSDDEEHLSDEDVQFFEENPEAGSFLDTLDRNGIARSKKETVRLHKLSRPHRVPMNIDDLPSVDSHDEDGDQWSERMDESNLELSGDEHDVDGRSSSSHQESDFDTEQPYERKPRKRHGSWEADEAGTVQRLPIKLADGRVVKTGGRVVVQTDSESGDEPTHFHGQDESQAHVVEDVSTGARFGRPAVANIIGTQSRKARIEMAKVQIAGICQDILADPESSLGLLRRLHTFSLAQISTPQSPTPLANDPHIRCLAMLSQLAVFKDVIPGYRIRPLTDTEKTEKVSQMVGRTREWEQGLVSVYQTYLRTMESELKGQTEFADLALKSMCTLLTEATHFNFRTNLMSAIMARLSKKSWDQSSEMCLQTLIAVFRTDLTGVPSLEIVRLLNRMVKERKFAVHPNVLSCLLHLRLKSELGGIRASETKAAKEGGLTIARWESRGKADRKRAKGKKVERPHMSKKAVKALKEKKEIEGQMREAEAEVDREEKANMHTETLKLLFVLYFRILKAPHWTPLLPPALQGLSRYAHLVNIDFFKDLMQVLKDLITRAPGDGEVQYVDVEPSTGVSGDQAIQHRLLCIVTAFELLSGQGEALNIDLRDFINHLYALILPISVQTDIEIHHHNIAPIQSGSLIQQTTADLLFRALSLAFPVNAGGAASPLRTAAFAKRLLIATLSFPATTALRSLEFVHGLLVKEPKLQALLSTDDRSIDGIYRPDLDDPQLSNPYGTSFWELAHLAGTHWDSAVRCSARKLALFNGM